MRRMAFVSRHEPTTEQFQLALAKGYRLVKVDDVDAFNMDAIKALVDAEERKTLPGEIPNFAVVNPAMALNILACVNNARIGVFENGQRSAEGGKPTFFAKALHLWAMPVSVVKL